MFKFEDRYLPGPKKSLCDGWCCGYAPIPRDPKESPQQVLSAEEQARIESLKKTKIHSKCYFETLDEIYEALDFELQHCISERKVREAEGQFSFRGKNYSYARVFDYENDEAWVEIREADGKILYGKAVAHNHKQELLPMTKVIKNKGKSILAYRLGTPSNVIEQLIREQRIVPLDNGSFEIFSREVVEGGSEHGQLARSGDYIKVDSAGFPYPNDAAFFVENHRHISGDEYEQIPKPLDAWTAEQPMCSEVEYLIREKGLVLNESDSACYFSAPLWGTVEMAAKDAVLVFYSIDRAEDGTIRDADFNFVARDEFDKTYRFC